MPTIHEYSGPLRATLLYFLKYYIFLYLQSFTKKYIYRRESGKCEKKKDGSFVSVKDINYYSKDSLAICVDRTVGNTLEQALPFLVSFWLCIFCNAIPSNQATTIAYWYIFFRSYYPVAFYYKCAILSTIPAYGCVVYFFYSLYLIL